MAQTLNPAAMRDKLRRMKIPVPAELDARADAHMQKLYRARQEKRQAERQQIAAAHVEALAAGAMQTIQHLAPMAAPAPLVRALKARMQTAVRQFVAQRCGHRRRSGRGAA